MHAFSVLSLVAVVPSLAYAAVHDVWVGGEGGELVFQPEAIGANVGDTVTFHFNPKNHTVSQSSFDEPCGLKEGGFDSGFHPVDAESMDYTEPSTFDITVEDDKPIWAYCRQKSPKNHCGQGMVFAVNCGPDGSENSFPSFKASAIAFGQALEASESAGAAEPSATEAESSSAHPSITPVYEIPPEPIVTVVTQVITLTLSDAPQPSVWTTTYGSYPGSADATPAAAEGVVHKVIVGGESGLAFDPPRVDAKPRDIIEFEFHQKNHTVTQGSFDNPCSKLDSETAFDSGFIPVEDNVTSDFPTWRLTVNDTNPVWAYCKQKTPASHCEAGMLFAINSVEDSPRNMNAYMGVAQALAANSNGSDSNGSNNTNNNNDDSTGDDGDGAFASGPAGIAVTALTVLFATFTML